MDSPISPRDVHHLSEATLGAEGDDMAESRRAGPVEEAFSLRQGLTREEDDELRRLHWLSQIGTLAVRKVERLLELRMRDRRGHIRPPREFDEEPADTPTGCTLDLPTVRRQLETMAMSRLIVPFNEDERQQYRELLEIEKTLLESLPRPS